MKSIVSSLVLVAVLASAGVNAAPATGSEKALTQKTGSVASKPAAVHGAIANSAKDTEPAGQHALSSTPKKQTLSKTSTTTSTTQHGSKKDKKRTRKHRKTQGEETGQKTKTKTKSNLSKSKSKSKDHLPASQNTPSASRTDRETSASLAKPKSENQPRDVVEAEEALYARRLPSRAQLKRIAEKIKNAKAKNAAGKSAKDGDQDTRDLTSDSLSSRELEEALEARFVKKLKQKWRESKANRLQKAATKAQGKADAAATKAGMNTEQSDARDIIEDEFEARDLADESDVLEARRSRWRKFAKSTPTDEPTDKREFEDDLAAREYFDEELEMREFDEAEDLFAREYFDDDELAARDYEDWEARDVSDEFDLRDFVEIDELD